MTNKLVWRLGKLPSPDEIRELVKDKIITQEEAREILFNSETEEERDKKSLESEIKFLRELVEKLSNNQATRIIETIKEIEVPYIKKYWYQPYQQWSLGAQNYNNGMYLCENSNLGTVGTVTNLNNSVTSDCSFTNIKTF